MNNILIARRLIRLSLCVAMILVGASVIVTESVYAQNQSGPTPYPTKDSDWPGTGPTKVAGWMIENRQAFWLQRAQKQGAIVFVGDSFLGNWYLAKVKIDQAFPKVKVANRAIGGDVSRGVLFRFQEDVLDLHPKAVVILIGSNDMSARGSIDGIVSNISALLDVAHKANAGMPIILCKLPPRNSPVAPVDPKEIAEINRRLTHLARDKSYVTLFDTFGLFTSPDGLPDPQYFKADLLHPNDTAYAKLALEFAKVFEKLKLQ